MDPVARSPPGGRVFMASSSSAAAATATGEAAGEISEGLSGSRGDGRNSHRFSPHSLYGDCHAMTAWTAAMSVCPCCIAFFATADRPLPLLPRGTEWGARQGCSGGCRKYPLESYTHTQRHTRIYLVVYDAVRGVQCALYIIPAAVVPAATVDTVLSRKAAGAGNNKRSSLIATFIWTRRRQTKP